MNSTAENIDKPGRTAKIKSSRFGEIEIDEDKVINLTSPILGFPDDLSFILVPHGPDSPFFWLHSTQNPDLAFVVIQPARIHPTYQPKIPAQVRKELQAEKEPDLELMTILTIPQGKPREMTVNLLAPMAINAKKRLAKQLLLDPAKYDPCWKVPLT